MMKNSIIFMEQKYLLLKNLKKLMKKKKWELLQKYLTNF